MVGSDILRSTVAADKVDDDGSDGGIDVDVKTRFAASATRTLDDCNSRAAMLLLSMARQNCTYSWCVFVFVVWNRGWCMEGGGLAALS
jgi:hypothetical protein